MHRLTACRESAFLPSELIAINNVSEQFYVDVALDLLRRPHKALLFNKMKQRPVPVFLLSFAYCCVPCRIETVIMLGPHFIVPSPTRLCSL